MEEKIVLRGRKINLVSLRSDELLLSGIHGGLKNTAVILWSSAKDYTSVDLCKHLLTLGAKIFFFGGDSCSEWDDLVDHLAIIEGVDGDLMTTWHEDESIADILEFAANYVSTDTQIDTFLLISIDTNKIGEEVKMLLDKIH